ncbi:putative DNA-binding transcriptional regulator YafY [Clostridium algifaecis]|uniref:DNA-binding transcriptional regulator YafY n=1 Tax=Clostridium algifaecis TaxID=1472040 RepID=A0ABS4KRY7_9CLOT|nr:transcriptional regulator [Clostridium algifaecis]MBP2032782.1 putative DNA-binding transcriptional regulator YafY [Clostridium algifaecis]
MSKFSHLLEIILTLQYKELVTASELSETLKVDKKTIYRYIDSLNKANIPVHTVKGRYGGFYIDKNFYMKPFNLTKEELKSLIMSTYLLTKENGFIYENQLKDAVCKIKQLSLNNSEEFNDFRDTGLFSLELIGNEESLEEKISKINISMNRGRSLSIDYFSINKNDSSMVKVDPYNLIFKEGSWYVIGYCDVKNDVDVFDLTRIKSLKITKDVYMRPHNFSLNEFLNKNCCTFNENKTKVVIKFTGKSVAFIKSCKWHINQHIKELSKDSILFTIYLDGTDDVKAWILGFGKDAEIIEPLYLRNEIKQEIDELNEKYKNF